VVVLSVGTAAGGENPLFRSVCRFEATRNETHMSDILMFCCELNEKERLGNFHTFFYQQCMPNALRLSSKSILLLH
jgi:hypothetical protein